MGFFVYLLGFCEEIQTGLPDLLGVQVLGVDHPLDGSIPS